MSTEGSTPAAEATTPTHDLISFDEPFVGHTEPKQETAILLEQPPEARSSRKKHKHHHVHSLLDETSISPSSSPSPVVPSAPLETEMVVQSIEPSPLSTTSTSTTYNPVPRCTDCHCPCHSVEKVDASTSTDDLAPKKFRLSDLSADGMTGAVPKRTLGGVPMDAISGEAMFRTLPKQQAKIKYSDLLAEQQEKEEAGPACDATIQVTVLGDQDVGMLLRYGFLLK